MLTSSASMLPSVPTMLIDEQRGDITEMIEALTAFGERLMAESPEAIVLVSPRWITSGPFGVDDSRAHRSMIDLPGFGVEPRYDCPGHTALARALVDQAAKHGVRAANMRRGVDTAASIPLHFVAPAKRTPIVPVSIGDGSREDHRAWGSAIRHVLNAWPGRVAFAIGGALSWNIHAFNLRREVPECAEMDERVIHVLRRGAWSELEAVVSKYSERALPEAELLHLEVLRGFLLMDDVPGHVLEYENSPGIGTVLVEFPLEYTGGAGD